jgi:hypothetical protein
MTRYGFDWRVVWLESLANRLPDKQGFVVGSRTNDDELNHTLN